MRKALALGTATAALAVGLSASPAQAQSVTFALTAGSLSIAEPGAATLTAGGLASFTGTTVSGSLGSTVVTDQRGGTTAWTSTISSTGFSDGSTTIAAGSVKAWVPSAVSTTGVVVATAGTYLAQATGLALTSSAQNFVTSSAVVGNNTATFAPSISVAIPNNATAGTYTGTVTQTVS